MLFALITIVAALALVVGVLVSPGRRGHVFRWVGRHSTGLFVLLGIGFAAAFLLPVRVGDGSVNLGLVMVAAATTVLVLVALSINLAGVDPDAEEFANSIAHGPVAERLLLRWLQRVRWRRWIGGLVGFLGGLCAMSFIGSNDFGRGAFVYPGLAGVALASFSAELHHLRPRRLGAQVADLSVRQLADYSEPSDQRLVAMTAAAGFATLGYALSSSASTSWAIASLAIVAVAFGLQHLVSHRRRPALGLELREADDLLRTLAVSRGIARPAVALGLATVGMALAPADAVGAEIAETVSWLAAIVTWWKNRGLGLKTIKAPRRPVKTRPTPASASLVG